VPRPTWDRVAWLPGCDIAVEMSDDAERQIVGFDLLLDHQLEELGAEAQWPPITRLSRPS